MTSRTHTLMLAVLCVMFVLAALPTLDYGGRDLRLLSTRSLDEAAFSEFVWNDSFELRSFTYGSLYPYAGIIASRILGHFGPVDQRDVILTLRFLALLSGVLAVALSFRLGATIWSPEAGLYAAGLLATSPVLFQWSAEAHPDTLQLALLTAAVLKLCHYARVGSRRQLAAAAGFAGLAFGTKYGGALFLPTIGFAVCYQAFRQPVPWPNRWWRIVEHGFLVVAVFAAAFSLTNPYAVAHPDQLLEDISFVGRIVGEEPGSWTGWFAVIFSVRTGVFITFPALLALGVAALSEHRSWTMREDRLVLLVWTLSFLIFLFARVRFAAPHYLLPVLPALSVLAARIIGTFYERWSLSLNVRAGLLAVIFAAQSAPSREFWTTRTTGLSEDPVVAAGLWLEENYDPETSVLYDAYAYVPSVFKRAQSFFGHAYTIIYLFQPDLVVVRSSIRNRYRSLDQPTDFRLTDDPSKAADFLYLRTQRYHDIHYTYAYLEADRVPPYRLAKDFGVVQIYASTKSTDHTQWDRARRAYNESGGFDPTSGAMALTAFGDVHLTAGNLEEAKVQYRRALQITGGNTSTHDRMATVLARQDSVDGAWDHYGRAASTTADSAGVWIRAGWTFAESGQYEVSRRASRRALTIAPDHPYPVYNITLSYLLEGDVTRAERAYTAATRRHPMPPETASVLRSLARSDRVGAKAKQLLIDVLGKAAAKQE